MCEMTPFSANVVLATYRCDGGDLVKFLVNEADISTVRGCQGQVYCSVENFKSAASELVYKAETMSLSEICTTQP